jgi:hypothetical protein
MTSCKTAALLTSAVALLASCDAGRAPGPAPVPLVDVAAGRLPEEVIVLAEDGQPCPSLEGATLVRRVVDAYCSYRVPQGWQPPADLPPSRVGHDALVVTPSCVLGDDVEELCDDLVGHWQGSMEFASGWPTTDGCVECRVMDVVPRLEILDAMVDPGGVPTQPLGGSALEPPVGAAAHGLALFRVAARATCLEGPPCPVEVRARQVLGRFPARSGSGAEWGSFLDLAEGIEAAVDDWLVARRTPVTEAGLDGYVEGGERTYDVGQLLLNLSLGWHPAFGGGMADTLALAGEGEPVPSVEGGTISFSWDRVNHEDFPLGVRAVFDALVYARCHGVLVFAAAGNATSGPVGGEGPVLPAAWEGMPTDRLPSCDGVRSEEDGADLPPVDPDHPLVVAVGAVTTNPDALDGAEAPFSRPGARPTLLAYGHEIVSGQVSGGHVMPPLTGTSASAVLLSATASLVTAVEPEHTPTSLLRRLAGPVPASSTDPERQAAEVQRRELGLQASPVFGHAVDRYGIGGASVWVRACGVLFSTPGWRCAAPQTWPASLSATTEWPTPPEVVVEEVVVEGEPHFSPSVAPTIDPLPDWPLCPECMLVRGTGRLLVTFDPPAGLIAVNAVPDPDASAPLRPFSLALHHFAVTSDGRRTFDALLTPANRTSSVKSLRLDLVTENQGQRRTSRIWIPVVEAVVVP